MLEKLQEKRQHTINFQKSINKAHNFTYTNVVSLSYKKNQNEVNAKAKEPR